MTFQREWVPSLSLSSSSYSFQSLDQFSIQLNFQPGESSFNIKFLQASIPLDLHLFQPITFLFYVDKNAFITSYVCIFGFFFQVVVFQHSHDELFLLSIYVWFEFHFPVIPFLPLFHFYLFWPIPLSVIHLCKISCGFVPGRRRQCKLQALQSVPNWITDAQ